MLWRRLNQPTLTFLRWFRSERGHSDHLKPLTVASRYLYSHDWVRPNMAPRIVSAARR